MALLYPSPYATGMSSLGFQSIYRSLGEGRRWVAHRAFLPDDTALWRRQKLPILTYEAQRPLSAYPVVGVSVAYELELGGLIEALDLAGIPPLRQDRDPSRHPFLLLGGPLTFSNPLPLAAYGDAILCGEADETIDAALAIIAAEPRYEQRVQALKAAIASCYVPALDGEQLPAMGRCSDSKLPARAAITTPHTELSNMFLIEAERGCSRQCGYCVMRRSTNGGMRLVAPETIIGAIPEHAQKVGLVGAAVSDHPKIVDIIEALVATGRGVSLSSLRPDRLNDRFVAALKKAGYRTLTTASDGASQRLRDRVDRKTRETHLLKAATLAREHKLQRMKLYMMVGLPDESDADIDELVRFAIEISRIVPLSLGIAPFVSKRNTPLDGLDFAGIGVVDARLARLRRGLKGRVDLRATSARWAWVEYVLAQGGAAAGRAVLDAHRAGGAFRHYRQAFANLDSAAAMTRSAAGASDRPGPHSIARRQLPVYASVS